MITGLGFSDQGFLSLPKIYNSVNGFFSLILSISLPGNGRSFRISRCQAAGSSICDKACLSAILCKTAAMRFPWLLFGLDCACRASPCSQASWVSRDCISWNLSACGKDSTSGRIAASDVLWCSLLFFIYFIM